MDIKDFDQYLAEIYEDRDDSHFRIGSMLSALEYEVRMLKQLIYSHLDRHNAEIEKSDSAWDDIRELTAISLIAGSLTGEQYIWRFKELTRILDKYADDLKRIPKR